MKTEQMKTQLHFGREGKYRKDSCKQDKGKEEELRKISCKIKSSFSK
jgi:hypothetical protein